MKRGIASIGMIGAFLALSACDQFGGHTNTDIANGKNLNTQTRPSNKIIPVPDLVLKDRNAPNILIVLMDDIGFSADSTFGGPIPTPHLDNLAAEGLLYNRFHTTAMCSPTRASLLTGRNHHRVEMGGIVNLAVGTPGYSSVLPKSAATIGKVLTDNGYNTAWFGKNHVTPIWELTNAGPFDRWPTGLGFEYFYGFMHGASDQISPVLVENTTVFDPENSGAENGYFFDKDMADQTIHWMSAQHAAAPDKPFMIYMAPGTGHEPHQAPKEWLEKFSGKFDQGWDKTREETFLRQKTQGIIPKDAVLTVRPDLFPAWSSLTPDQKKLTARFMEAHAAQRAYFDDQFGRVVQAIKETGEWDNTLVIFIDGDNGASGEGGLYGTLLGLLNRPDEPVEYMLENIDQIGGPHHVGNYSAIWAWAMNTPFQWFKQHASHLGGSRNGVVISWPDKIKEGGGLRSQYAHVNDIAPTLYEAAGIKAPDFVNGVKQIPIDGSSLVYSFNQADAKEQHTTQYYEMLGNSGIYQNGWLAVLDPPNVMWAPKANQDKIWKLYNLEQDYSQSKNLAKQFPDRLSKMVAAFSDQLAENGSAVLDGGIQERANPANRPSRFTNGSRVFLPSKRPLLDDAFPSINNRAWSISVPVIITDTNTQGTVISQGGWPYGWGVYLFDGEPTFLYLNEPHPVARLKLGEKLKPGKYVLEFGMRPSSNKPSGPAQMFIRTVSGSEKTLDISATVRSHWGANGVGIGREVGTLVVEETGKPFVFEGVLGPLTFTYLDAE
ncbi:MAG: hypothetical protein COA43_01415 [Robiginitomaculum sp.]|nr:MAG: hypothetical protein COA43_01415 [Robiginitomaculum sp.]